jgi:hypothetical protein
VPRQRLCCRCCLEVVVSRARGHLLVPPQRVSISYYRQSHALPSTRHTYCAHPAGKAEQSHGGSSSAESGQGSLKKNIIQARKIKAKTGAEPHHSSRRRKCRAHQAARNIYEIPSDQSNQTDVRIVESTRLRGYSRRYFEYHRARAACRPHRLHRLILLL